MKALFIIVCFYTCCGLLLVSHNASAQSSASVLVLVFGDPSGNQRHDLALKEAIDAYMGALGVEIQLVKTMELPVGNINMRNFAMSMAVGRDAIAVIWLQREAHRLYLVAPSRGNQDALYMERRMSETVRDSDFDALGVMVHAALTPYCKAYHANENSGQEQQREIWFVEDDESAFDGHSTVEERQTPADDKVQWLLSTEYIMRLYPRDSRFQYGGALFLQLDFKKIFGVFASAGLSAPLDSTVVGGDGGRGFELYHFPFRLGAGVHSASSRLSVGLNVGGVFSVLHATIDVARQTRLNGAPYLHSYLIVGLTNKLSLRFDIIVDLFPVTYRFQYNNAQIVDAGGVQPVWAVGPLMKF